MREPDTRTLPAETPPRAAASPKRPPYVFAWPFVAAPLEPRGGTTRGAPGDARDAPRPRRGSGSTRAGLSARERDRAAILAMAGDYRASFDFLETIVFSPGAAPARPYRSWGTERIYAIEDRGDFVSLQHILVMFAIDEEGTAQSARSCRSTGARTGATSRRSVLVFAGDETVRDARGGARGAPRRVVADRLPGRRLAALRIGRALGAQRRGVDLGGRRGVAPAAAPRALGAQRLSGARGAQPPHDPADRLGPRAGQSEARARRDGRTRRLAREIGVDRYERVRDFDFAAADAYWKRHGAVLGARARRLGAARGAGSRTCASPTTLQRRGGVRAVLRPADRLEAGEAIPPDAQRAEDRARPRLRRRRATEPAPPVAGARGFRRYCGHDATGRSIPAPSHPKPSPPSIWSARARAPRSIPTLYALARARIATLLGIAAPGGGNAAASAQIAALPSWPSSPLFGERERACLAFAEQFVLDVSGTTDAQRAALTAALGADAAAFAQALYAIDFELRLRAVFTALFGADPLPVDAGRRAREALARARGDDAGDRAAHCARSDDHRARPAARRARAPLPAVQVAAQRARGRGRRRARRSSTRSTPTSAAISPSRTRWRCASSTRCCGGPGDFPAGLAEQVHAHYAPAQIVEIVLDVTRNALNKFAVAMGVDGDRRRRRDRLLRHRRARRARLRPHAASRLATIDRSAPRAERSRHSECASSSPAPRWPA